MGWESRDNLRKASGSAWNRTRKRLGEQQDSQGSAWLTFLGSLVQHRQKDRQQTDSIFRSSAVPVSKTSPQMGLLAVDVPAQEAGERVAGPSPDNLASF